MNKWIWIWGDRAKWLVRRTRLMFLRKPGTPVCGFCSAEFGLGNYCFVGSVGQRPCALCGRPTWFGWDGGRIGKPKKELKT